MVLSQEPLDQYYACWCSLKCLSHAESRYKNDNLNLQNRKEETNFKFDVLFAPNTRTAHMERVKT